MITEKFKDLIRRCAQCGTCTASCPTSELSDFNIRRLVRTLQLDLQQDKDFLKKIPWLCTLCYRCSVQCTEGLEIPKLVFALRELALESKAAPDAIAQARDTIKKAGSPYLSRTRTKDSWKGDSIKTSADADLLYWVGCTSAMMVNQIPKATAQVLDKLGIKFKVLNDEPCCGEPLINLGFLDEAKEIAAKVMKIIEESKVKRLVTSCSGCYYTFTKLYPEKLGIEFHDLEVLHLAQLLEGHIKPDSGFKVEKPLTVTYHDPCSLGRHTNIYDAPRKVIQAIEGVKLVETNPNKELTTCCGGGGGLWSVDYQLAMEIASKKIEREIAKLGVDGLVTTCPLCYLNFRRALAKNKSNVKVYDLAEIVSQSVL